MEFWIQQQQDPQLCRHACDGVEPSLSPQTLSFSLHSSALLEPFKLTENSKSKALQPGEEEGKETEHVSLLPHIVLKSEFSYTHSPILEWR